MIILWFALACLLASAIVGVLRWLASEEEAA